MIEISGKNIINAFVPSMEPAASCCSGDVVRFHTLDCFADQIVSENMAFADTDESNANPATGPLFVDGAMPGDILKVDVLSIELNDRAVVAEIPGAGISGLRADSETIKIMLISEAGVVFNNDITLPLKPMIGVIGTAPESGEVSTEDVGINGSNLDCTPICDGASIYLPVYQKGALLAIGDLHAVMGEGEVCVCGAETAGTVDVRVNVIKNVSIPLPFIVSSDKAMCVVSADTLDSAAQQATFNMIDFVEANSSLTKAESGMLLSLVGDLKISQMVNPHRTCRMEVPLSVLNELGIEIP